jgi:hypothetical protein
MFYCEPCRYGYDWPEGISIYSYGNCEICNETRVNHDRKSGSFPEMTPERKSRFTERRAASPLQEPAGWRLILDETAKFRR